ncbi:MAG TPA: RagB/SusD family nutrient uptake outer membrane protein, partial [Bacteroidales bacterium]|nr:RagB/SusD family nutrient uptake outer membrane protein [Bacteroidales bacterium]HQJ21475.1 RagB/SusD family nutrient uptake outer membrane protein [Bacteroidales bacterium]HRC89577.1 RagB/SusD family nutrient uptake outer membrane protein [Bacteroidales bacterium]
KNVYHVYSPLYTKSIVHTWSCEDRLDISQPGTTAVEDFYKTDADAEEAIAAVYSQVRSMHFTWLFLQNLLSDDVTCGGGGRGDNPSLEQINEYTFNPANSNISGMFSSLYSMIYRCNMVIDNVTGGTPAQDRAIAEAKAIRAFANFYLVNLWGTPPLVLHQLAPSEYRQPNSNSADFWAQIEKDLTEAISSNALPEKSSPSDKSIGARISKQVAQALLGKAYLWQKKYNEAAAQFNAVVNSGKYELISDYENMYRVSQDLGPERMWEIIGLNDPANTWTGASSGITNNMLGWRGDHMNMMGYFFGMHDIHYGGWGFSNATPEVYQAFVEMEGPNGFRFKSTVKNYQDVLNICPYPNFYGTDLRLTVGGQGLYGHSGVFTWKYRVLRNEALEGGYGYAWHCNWIYMRYAEVLLLGAEASLMSAPSDGATALNYVNQIRSRAHLAPLSSVTLDDIKKEKRLELWAEGARFLDLQRWGDAPAALAKQGEKVPTFWGFKRDGVSDSITYPQRNSVYGYKVGKHELLPFPEHEMRVNPNLKQNPGW